MGSLSVRTVVLVWEGRWKLGWIVEMFVVFRRWSRWKFHCKSFISITIICSYIKGAWELNLCGKNKTTYFLGKEYRAMLVAKMELVREGCVHAWRLVSSIHLKKNNLESFLKHRCQNYEAWLVTSIAQCYHIEQLFWLCVYPRHSTPNFRAEMHREKCETQQLIL